MVNDLVLPNDDMRSFLIQLLNTPSPTGYHKAVNTLCEEVFSTLPITLAHTRKGALVLTVEGEADDAPRGLTAHIDTLGAMVSEISGSGRLKLTNLGSWTWGSVEGEGVTILTRDGRNYRGTIMPVKASVHIFGGEAREFKRSNNAYEVRLDARTATTQETRELGIEIGDFVAFDPRVEVNDNGFIRSRHLDDKASVACIYGAIKALVDADIKPAQRTTILISNYEEVGHGAATGFPADMAELLAVDIGIVGGSQHSDEFTVSICAKDAGGPYHVDMTNKLVELAETERIPHKIDTFPYYGSDGEAFWRAGGDVIVGLIGPGVDATHHYERTHMDSITATTQLIAAYLQAE